MRYKIILEKCLKTKKSKKKTVCDCFVSIVCICVVAFGVILLWLSFYCRLSMFRLFVGKTTLTDYNIIFLYSFLCWLWINWNLLTQYMWTNRKRNHSWKSSKVHASWQIRKKFDEGFYQYGVEEKIKQKVSSTQL